LKFSSLALVALLASVGCAHVPEPAALAPASSTADAPSAAAAPAPAPAIAPPPTAKPALEELPADAQRTTASGATFTAPAGWTLNSQDSFLLLQPPEKDSQIAIVELHAKDAAAAASAAWAKYRPQAKRTVLLATPRPARDGWEEEVAYDYETSPNEKATVFALALRKGDVWTVLVIDGTDATFEKRSGPANLLVGSIRPKGYTRESFAGRKAHPLDAERLSLLKDFVRESMDALGVPGVGLAFVDGGKVVWEGGLGVREFGKPTPVDADTLFIAASNTKGMTTLLLARLVDEKKLSWDEPVVKVYPAFRLGDAATTSSVLVKNLVCACTGMPRQDLEWLFEFKNATPASSLRLLGTMKPTSKFGEVFQYSNLMAAAAGYIAGHLVYPKLELGAAYDAAMQKEIFDPLGMRSSTFSMRRAVQGNHASPHGEDVDGTLRVGSNAINYSVGPLRPAGGLWTSSHDFIRYVQLEANRGKLPDGTVFVSEENILQRRVPQVQLGERMTYGMGMVVDSSWGVPVVHHGGDLAGFHSDFFLLPDQGTGAVLLTNSDTGGLLRRAFMRRLLEVVFDGQPEAVEDVRARAATHNAQRAKERERLVVPADPSAVRQLATRYKSPELGGLTVRRRGSGTVFDFGEWQSAVASRKNDDGTVSFFSIDPNKAGFEFVVAERDGKRALVIRDGQHEYAFLEMR
jgi:CubicO group peptidase (beta-lactamase class C family)